MTSVPDNINPRIWTLTNAVCQGTISKEEAQELESLLTADPRALEFYVDFLKINVEILWLLSIKPHSTIDSGDQAPPAPLAAPPDRSPILGFLGDWANFFNQHSPLSYLLLFVMLGMTIFASSFWLRNTHTGVAVVESQFTAQITCMRDCQWSATMPAMSESEQLLVGQQLQLDKGLVQVTYYNGAVVLLEGPVSYTVDSQNSGFLDRGKLVARADTKQSGQFTITTPNARFVDMGTAFGVAVEAEGRAAIAVFTGKVMAEAKKAGGGWTAQIALKEGQAGIYEKAKFTRQVYKRSDFPTLQPVPPAPSSYERWLEASRELQGRGDLVAYYDFQPDLDDSTVLLNHSASGAKYDGEIQNADFVDGRFPGKKCLEFMAADSGVRVNLPDEYKQMTVIAWVNINQLVNNYHGILTSDGWTQPGNLHFQIRKNGQLGLHIFSGWAGVNDYWSTKTLTDDYLGRWCMIAGVVDTDQNSVTIYVNGEFFEKLPTIGQMLPARIGSATIGGWNRVIPTDPDYPRNFSGRIDELMIFQNALTAEKIKKIYQSSQP